MCYIFFINQYEEIQQFIQQLTCEKYDGNTHRWSSNLWDWHRSRSSKRFSFVAVPFTFLIGDKSWLDFWWVSSISIRRVADLEVEKLTAILLIESWLSCSACHCGICCRLWKRKIKKIKNNEKAKSQLRINFVMKKNFFTWTFVCHYRTNWICKKISIFIFNIFMLPS